MKTRTQILTGTGVVLAAAVVTFAMTRNGDAAVQQSMEGHDHAAMLAGMDQNLGMPGSSQRLANRGGFDKLGARANYGDNFHRLGSSK